MEPKPEPASACDLTEWSSSHYAYSPGGWWRAEIGTDYNLDESGTFRIERDDAAVKWEPAHEPSEDIAAAWLVVEKMNDFGYWCQMRTPFGPPDSKGYDGYWCGFTPHWTTGWNGRPDDETARNESIRTRPFGDERTSDDWV